MEVVMAGKEKDKNETSKPLFYELVPLFSDRFYDGLGLAVNNRSKPDEVLKGLKMLEECVEDGCVSAADTLGFLYQAHIHTIPYDYDLSAYWYKKAYEMGGYEEHLESALLAEKDAGLYSDDEKRMNTPSGKK
jgi:TPR repeat protein